MQTCLLIWPVRSIFFPDIIIIFRRCSGQKFCQVLVPDVKVLVSDVKVLVSDVEVLVSDGKVLVPDGKVLVPDGKVLVLDGRVLVPGCGSTGPWMGKYWSLDVQIISTSCCRKIYRSF